MHKQARARRDQRTLIVGHYPKLHCVATKRTTYEERTKIWGTLCSGLRDLRTEYGSNDYWKH